MFILIYTTFSVPILYKKKWLQFLHCLPDVAVNTLELKLRVNTHSFIQCFSSNCRVLMSCSSYIQQCWKSTGCCAEKLTVFLKKSSRGSCRLQLMLLKRSPAHSNKHHTVYLYTLTSLCDQLKSLISSSFKTLKWKNVHVNYGQRKYTERDYIKCVNSSVCLYACYCVLYLIGLLQYIA